MDVQKLNTLGWTAQTALRQGIEKVYREFAQLHPAGL
jgi:GDP-L-fucose synthase